MIAYPYQPSPSGNTHWVYDDPSGAPEQLRREHFCTTTIGGRRSTIVEYIRREIGPNRKSEREVGTPATLLAASSRC